MMLPSSSSLDRLEVLKEQYADILLRHVLEPSEDNLVEAASIGRRFIIHGVPTEEAVAAHTEALARVGREHPELTVSQSAATVSEPLMEMLMAYGLNFRHQLDSSQVLNDMLRQEIEERKKIEANLQTRGEELARSNADLEKFAYVVSHDLQAPLRQVGSFAGLLERHYGQLLEGDGEEFLSFITRGVTRMQDLIRALLRYSRIGRNQLSPVELDCNVLLQRVIGDLGHDIEAHNGEVITEELPVVTADPTLLGLVFQNLIQNSLKFVKEAPPAIRVSGQQSGPHTHFSVQDNGIGIEPRYHEEIFQVFRKLHRADEFAGTGIGLAICRKIVERHGGRLWVESRPGGGANFRFTIPQDKGSLSEIAEGGRE
jgi:light-regulated signal transduction histidine kinase (bacteriophytochrome)